MDSKNNIIAIDSAGSILNISLYKDGEIKSIKGEGESSNNEELASLLKKILDDNSLNINDINTIIINKGPGSFTGLRIGYAFLEGIYSCLNINVSQISLLVAVRYFFKDLIKENDIICQHIRKGNYFIYNVINNKLEFNDNNFISTYLKQNDSKAYLINDVQEGYRTFNCEFLCFLPSEVLLKYYLYFDVPNIKNLLEFEPNYIQNISAKKINER